LPVFQIVGQASSLSVLIIRKLEAYATVVTPVDNPAVIAMTLILHGMTLIHHGMTLIHHGLTLIRA